MPKKNTPKQSSFIRMFRLLMVGLVIILIWRGIDGLLSLYLFPNNETLSDISSIVIAIAIIFVFKLRMKELD